MATKNKAISPDAVMAKNGINPQKIANSKSQKNLAKREVDYLRDINNTALIQSVSKVAWIEYLTDLDIRQWCNVLLWENVPNQIPSWLINQMAYYYGALAGFNYCGKFYILPWIQNGKINSYGLPNTITPITYNGTNDGTLNLFSENFECIIDNSGNYNEDANAIIFYPTLPRWNQGNIISTFVKNRKVIEQMADILARINIQVVVTNKKIFLKCQDAKEAQVILRQLNKALASDSPFCVISSMSTETVELQPKETNASDLWLHLKGFNDLRNMTNGVANDGFFDKKERKITDEAEGSQEQTNLILHDRLYFANLFIEQCKLQFSDGVNKIEGIEKMTVRINDLVTDTRENEAEEEGDENGNDDDI